MRQERTHLLVRHWEFSTFLTSKLRNARLLCIEVVESRLPSNDFAGFGHLETLAI